MRKVLVEKAIPITILIRELEELNLIDHVVELKKYPSNSRVNVFDLLDKDEYLLKNLYEIVEE